MMQPSYNIVRDWNKLQGMTDATDGHIQVLRDLNSRLISLENSSNIPIAIGIATYIFGPKPAIKFVLKSKEIRQLALNQQNGPLQYIHIFDPYTKEPLGPPQSLRSNSNSMVLRYGINKVWVDYFWHPSFSAAK